MIMAWRQIGISTLPSLTVTSPSDSISGLYRPRSWASLIGTHFVFVTSLNTRLNSSWSFGFRMCSVVQWTGVLLYSEMASVVLRVSIGNSLMHAPSFSSQRNSVGHIVVRPAEEGNKRRSRSAKNRALRSSVFPRENSPASATTSLSDFRSSISS